MSTAQKIRVLVVDDSAVVRKILVEALTGEPDIDVVGTAPDPYVARDKILALKPDVLTLDIEMPRMDGLTFLKKLMHYHPLPVIVISSLAQASCSAAVEAMRLGAVEALAKPNGPTSIGDLRKILAQKIRAAAMARSRLTHATEDEAHEKEATRRTIAAPVFNDSTLIVIGASTGGVSALQSVLTRLPKEMPGIAITQHIPAAFSHAFASRLNNLCALEIKEAADGDLVSPGRVLIAPGDRHLLIQKGSKGYVACVKDGPQVCYQRPSVDVLFHSAARVAGAHCVAAILTGMGADGADGMLALKRSGAHTIAQDEASCVVFGMPKEAIARGGVDEIVSLNQVPEALRAAVSRSAPAVVR